MHFQDLFNGIERAAKAFNVWRWQFCLWKILDPSNGLQIHAEEQSKTYLVPVESEKRVKF